MSSAQLYGMRDFGCQAKVSFSFQSEYPAINGSPYFSVVFGVHVNRTALTAYDKECSPSLKSI